MEEFQVVMMRNHDDADEPERTRNSSVYDNSRIMELR